MKVIVLFVLAILSILSNIASFIWIIIELIAWLKHDTSFNGLCLWAWVVSLIFTVIFSFATSLLNNKTNSESDAQEKPRRDLKRSAFSQGLNN